MEENEKRKIEKRIQRYKSYYSHMNDFNQIVELCKIIEADYTNEKNMQINSALYRYCVITYAKAFNDGTRSKIDERIFNDLPGDPIGTHRYYIDLRNKSIAHREDSFDSIQLGVIKNSEEEVLGIVPLEIRKTIDEISGIIQLRLLSEVAISHLQKCIKNETDEIIRIIRENPWLDSGEPIGVRLSENGYLTKLENKDA